MVPDFKMCLAMQVLCDIEDWPSVFSPRTLRAFLDGTSLRASQHKEEVPLWKIYGPLEQENFFQPLVAKTGHPSLTIKWAMAMELIHESHEDSLRALRGLCLEWFQAGEVESKVLSFIGEEGERELWAHLVKRPGMYLGEPLGYLLHAFFDGILKGGDWLELDAMPIFGEAISRLESESVSSYGSHFGLYRVYNGNLKGLFQLPLFDRSPGGSRSQSL